MDNQENYGVTEMEKLIKDFEEISIEEYTRLMEKTKNKKFPNIVDVNRLFGGNN